MICVIVVCLAAAGTITYKTRSKGGIPKKFAKEMMWVKCNECEAEYQINKLEYFTFLEKNTKPWTMEKPPLVCEKCGEKSVYRAVKCEKCESIFEPGWKSGDFEDRCPKCGYSKIEVDRKAAAAVREEDS